MKNISLGTLLSAALLIAQASSARAQMVDDAGNAVVQGPGDQASSAVEGSDNTSGVYVRDSAVALEKLAHAQRMEGLKEWGKSADLYQEILEKYQDRVVPAGVDKSNRIVQYTSVTEAVRQALCKWPAAGLDVYRARYETTAANLVNTAAPGDLATLHKVYLLYFVTDSAKQAGIRLMDAYFETGEYSATAQIGRQLLDWHPNVISERPMILYRTALAEKLCDDMDSAKLRLKELQGKYAQSVGMIRGEDAVLADSLAEELKKETKIVRAATTDSWLTMGGDSSRGKISSATGKPGAKLYSVNLSQHAPNADPSVRAMEQNQHKTGSQLGVMPVTDRGELYFQDNVRMYAVSLESGLPLAGWAATYPSAKGQYQLPGNAAAMPAGQQFCVTLTDKYVTAVMGLPDHIAEMSGQSVSEARLVCLDRATGKEIWAKSMHDLPESQSQLSTLKIGGAPLVVGDNIYVAGHGGKGQQFEDCYVLCYGLDHGEFRWSCYLSSAASNDMMMLQMGGGVGGTSDIVSHLAYASGRVYAVSNLGAVAAVDAYSGTIIWLDIYRDAADQPMNGMNGFRGMGMMLGGGQPGVAPQTPPWVYNPTVVQDGKVFILPSDKKAVLVYDSASGKEIKRIDLNDMGEDNSSDTVGLGTPDTLLGVLGDSLILTSPGGAWRIPWKTYDPKKAPTEQDGYWQSAPIHSDEKDVRGRGFVTANMVYVASGKDLVCLKLASGMVSYFPATANSEWDPTEEGPGNIIAAQDQLIIAGDKRVDVYTDLDLAIAKLNKDVSASPADPQVRLRYAEIMFAAGQLKIAQEKLADGLQLMTGPQGIAGGPLRDRAFSDALTFAGKFPSHGASTEDTNHMFDSAAATAQSPSQQVAWRMARAKFDLDGKDYAGAVDCFQQILSDENMRLVPLPDPQTNVTSQAGLTAEKSISQIDPEKLQLAYAKYETEAATKLAAARAANDPDQLLKIAQIYPNAQVARDSMIAAADVYESKTNYRMATQVLRRLLNKYPDSGRLPVLEAMARNYLRMPGRLDVSIARLGMAAQSKPNSKLTKPLTLPNGTVLDGITLKEAHDALTKYNATVSAESLPEFNIPSKEELVAYRKTHSGQSITFQPDLLLPNAGLLLKPADGFARYDRIATWAKDIGVSIYTIGATTPAAVCPAVTGPVQNIAWVGDKALVWGDKSINLFAGDSGKPAWKLDITTLPTMEITASEPPPEITDDQTAQQQLVVRQQAINNRRRAMIIAGNGVAVGVGAIPVAPPNAPQAGGPEQIDQVRPVGDRIIVATTNGRILAIDSNDGQIAWQTRVSGHAVDHLCANDDFTVMRIVDDQSVRLVVLNSFNGELVGRKSFLPGGGEFPQNIALSPDGTLVYTTLNLVCIKDLYEANLSERGMEPQASSPATNANPPLFLACDGPDQLLVAQGHIFAVGDSGREIHVYDLDSAKPTPSHASAAASGGADAAPLLFPVNNTLASSKGVAIKVSGNYFLVRQPKGVVGYKLSDPSRSWNQISSIENVNVTDWIFGKESLLLLEHRIGRLSETNKVDPRVQILSYSRKPVPKHPDDEAGLLMDTCEINNASGVGPIQPVTGGIVYVDGDNTLHTLLGAAGHIPQ